VRRRAEQQTVDLSEPNIAIPRKVVKGGPHPTIAAATARRRGMRIRSTHPPATSAFAASFDRGAGYE
jgi:hypothetical protein